MKLEKMNFKRALKGLVLGSALVAAGGAMAADGKPYKIEGDMLDEKTFLGMKIYQRGRCEACHGPDAKGGAAFPNLLDGVKKLSKEEVFDIVRKGRNSMPPMIEGIMAIKLVQKAGASEDDALNALYGYLIGRSEGAIPPPPAKLKKMK